MDKAEEQKQDEVGTEETFIDDANTQEEIMIDDTPMEFKDDDLVEGMEVMKVGSEMKVGSDAKGGFSGHTDSVYSVHVNPTNPSMAVSGGGDDKAYVWNTSSGQQLYAVEGHTDTVNNVAFSHDGSMFAVGSMDGTITVHNSADASLISTLEGPASDIEFFAWHPKGPVIVAGSADTTLWMWTASNGKCMQVYSAHMGAVLCGSFTHDGKVVVSGSEDGSAIAWNPRSAQPIHHFKGASFHEGPINALACHPSQRLLLTGSQDGTACFANIDNGKVLAKYEGHEDSVEGVGFCKNLKLGATCSLDGKLKIWDLNTQQCRTTCDHQMGVVKLQWGNTEPLIYTGCLDGVVRCWDSRNGSEVAKWNGHTDAVLSLSLAANDSLLVTGSDDKSALMFQR